MRKNRIVGLIKKEVGESRVVNRRVQVGSSGGALVGKTNGRAATLPAIRQAVAEGAGRRAEFRAEPSEFQKNSEDRSRALRASEG